MFYEETVIDGVLHWRGTPTGEWIAKTAQQLTEILLEARRKPQQQVPVYGPLWIQPQPIIPQQPRAVPGFPIPPWTVTC